MPENDPDLLYQALDTIRVDEARRTMMARGARARAEELAWARIAASYATVYSEFLT